MTFLTSDYECTMDDKNPILLSICIPTYNQPDKARMLLQSLLPQVNSDVEIVVRDDSSNNETERIVVEFNEKFPIRYFRGERGGLDRAIIFLTQEARGEYVWWIGDDLLERGAIQRVLRHVSEYPETTLIVVNSRETTASRSAFELGNDHFFRDRNEVIEQIADGLGFITATLFRREKSLSGIEKAKRRIGSAWVCLYLILHVLSQEGKYYFLSTTYVISDHRDPRTPAWYDGFTVFAVNFVYIVREFTGKFRRKSLRKMLSGNFAGIWRGILVYRAKGYTHDLGSPSPKLPILFKLYWSFPEFWIALPLLVLPRGVVRFLYIIYRTVRGKQE